MRHMYFEDFLEGIVRLASIVALPTATEVDAAGAEDAGAFMLTLYHMEKRAPYHSFVSHRSSTWHAKPHQRIYKCVGHLLRIVHRVIEANGHSALSGSTRLDGGNDRGVHLLESTAGRCCERLLSGGGFLALPPASVSGDLLASLAEVDAEILAMLRRVPAFAALTEENLTHLRGALSVARYEEGEYVFYQGDEGDVFYLIIGGEAEALRAEPDDHTCEERLVATLASADCFGERALLRNEARAASIVAKGGRLYVAYISRDDFEACLGRPLSSFGLVSGAPAAAAPAVGDET